MRHSPKGGRVEVVVEDHGDMVEVSVSDEGPGSQSPSVSASSSRSTEAYTNGRKTCQERGLDYPSHSKLRDRTAATCSSMRPCERAVVCHSFGGRARHLWGGVTRATRSKVVGTFGDG
ncbi:MAG: hypothetical protein IPM54_28130 [Polyangiaceae bacterium]|nr:hypothetical protein [Polyangiaceae bacterium]